MTVRLLKYACLLICCGALAVPVSCVDPEEASELARQNQTIYHGSRTPTVVSLSAGQQLAIGYLANSDGEPWCSGTLIDRDVVVTAQHCTEGAGANDLYFGVGDPHDPKAFFEVQKVTEHASLDVALLFLRQDALSVIPELEPIPAIREALDRSMIGQQVEAAGFGATHDGSTGLYFVSVTLFAIEEQYYSVDGHGQRGICFGDSGGPILVQRDGRHAMVAGVESYGDESCVDQDHLTRLDIVADWMDQQQGDFDPNDTTTDNSSGDKPPGNDSASTPSNDSSSGGSGDKPPVDNDQGTSQDPTDSPSDDGQSDDQGDGGWGQFPGCSVGSGASTSLFGLMLPLLALAMRRRKGLTH